MAAIRRFADPATSPAAPLAVEEPGAWRTSPPCSPPARPPLTLRDSAATAASGQIQQLKIPDAVVALAQAAAKANDLPGWPLFSPPKLQLHKCTKCSREFCSSIAFRRHTRVHRRTLKVDKDFPKNRDLVAAFWDKLTVDQAKIILSLDDVSVEGVSAISILTSLSSWMYKPGYASLPLAYARAGNELLDLIQTTASRQPISSNELFSILDEASENTFLSTNTVACLQKFLFDGDADKVATELKNVIACTSYMLEQKLIEAWSADKAAEALRCQELLVEEEEAAQKRQAELVERKRMKKLRQKEQRSKDLKDENAAINLLETMDDSTGSPEIQSPQYHLLPTPVASDNNGFNVDLSVEDTDCASAHEMNTCAARQQVLSNFHLDGPVNLAHNNFVSGSANALKHPALVRHSHYRDQNGNAAANRNKTWTWKARTEIEEQQPKDELDIHGVHEMVENKNSRLLIGSISVAIEDGSECLRDVQYSKDHPTTSQLKISNPSEVKVAQLVTPNDGNVCPAGKNHSPLSGMTDEDSSSCSNRVLAKCGDLQGNMLFRNKAATFLSQRWKDAITSDHVKLVLCPEN